MNMVRSRSLSFGFFLGGLLVFVAFFLVSYPFSHSEAQAPIQMTRLSSGDSSVAFMKDLRQGDRNADVKALQLMLNLDVDTQVAGSGLGSRGLETDFFGPATRRAVVAFQEKYASEVLIPAGLMSGNGFVGPKTRAKLNMLAIKDRGLFPTATPQQTPSVSVSSAPSPAVLPSPAASATSTKPVILRISPESGPYGTPITITGLNFQAKNYIATSYDLYKDVPSSDGKTIVFTLQNEAFRKISEIKKRNSKMQPVNIPFYISVKNENGTSTTPVLFTLTIQ